MGINAKEHYINDFSEELIKLYDCISKTDKQFFQYAEAMDASWENAERFFRNNNELVDVFIGFRNGQIDKEGINIRTFDKEYLVSFMNRNDKKVTHLLITNY